MWLGSVAAPQPFDRRQAGRAIGAGGGLINQDGVNAQAGLDAIFFLSRTG
jgi:hypothetical protein